VGATFGGGFAQPPTKGPIAAITGPPHDDENFWTVFTPWLRPSPGFAALSTSLRPRACGVVCSMRV